MSPCDYGGHPNLKISTPWGLVKALGLDLPSAYVSVFTWQKFITDDGCAFPSIVYTIIKKVFFLIHIPEPFSQLLFSINVFLILSQRNPKSQHHSWLLSVHIQSNGKSCTLRSKQLSPASPPTQAVSTPPQVTVSHRPCGVHPSPHLPSCSRWSSQSEQTKAITESRHIPYSPFTDDSLLSPTTHPSEVSRHHQFPPPGLCSNCLCSLCCPIPWHCWSPVRDWAKRPLFTEAYPDRPT